MLSGYTCRDLAVHLVQLVSKETLVFLVLKEDQEKMEKEVKKETQGSKVLRDSKEAKETLVERCMRLPPS